MSADAAADSRSPDRPELNAESPADSRSPDDDELNLESPADSRSPDDAELNPESPMDERMADRAELSRFYQRAYTEAGPGDGARYARWRALGARAKADHVLVLCDRANVRPASTLEVGCGDGALLDELRGHRFGGRLAGVEIAPAAVEIARARLQPCSVELYDGAHLPCSDGAYELGILSHVLEHVRDPVALLCEVARACTAVFVEVPLEANLSARRSGKRAHSAEIGHLQLLSRAQVRALAAAANLQIVAELEDPLTLAAQMFFASGPRARAWAAVKWSLRRGLHSLAPALARRLFTVHYACLCQPERPAAPLSTLTKPVA